MKRGLFFIACYALCALGLIRAIPASGGGGGDHCALGLNRLGAGDSARKLSRVDRNCICDFYPASNPATCNKLSEKYKIKSPAEKLGQRPDELARRQKLIERGSNFADRPGAQDTSYKQASESAALGKETAEMESSISKDVGTYSRETKGNLLKYTAQELDRAAQDKSVPMKYLQNDYQIFQAASKNYRENDSNAGFTEKLAASAKDPQVRELMLMYSTMDTVERKADESFAIAQQKIEGFGGMVKRNERSGSNLAQAGEEPSGRAISSIAPEKKGGMISDVADSGLGGERTQDSSGNAKDEAKLRQKESAEDSIRSRLRDQLRAELARANQKKKSSREEELLGEFGGDLNGSLASYDEAGEAEEDLGNLIGANAAKPGFSMAHSETDAFVKQAIHGLDSIQSGILESESLGIFARVKEYYNRCAQTECVSSR